MDAYTGFAEVYDEFMSDIPYDEWSKYIKELLELYGISKGILLELGCGTGSITERLADYGFEMIGIDLSQEMLTKAMKKKQEKESNTLYLLQDIREFELYGTVAAVICLCDTMNYILEEEEITEIVKGVNNYLDPGGMFIFDMKTEYYYKNVVGDCTLAENGESASYIWENYFYEDEKINEYNLTIFKKVQEHLYERQDEQHLQRAFSIEEIETCIKKGGMELVEVYDAFTRQPPNRKSERVYFVAREAKQPGKLYL